MRGDKPWERERERERESVHDQHVYGGSLFLISGSHRPWFLLATIAICDCMSWHHAFPRKWPEAMNAPDTWCMHVDGPYNKVSTVKASGSRGVYDKFHAHFYTNKVPWVVLQFLSTGTHLGGEGTNVTHELGTAGPTGEFFYFFNPF
jgi:hypothetical protein